MTVHSSGGQILFTIKDAAKKTGRSTAEVRRAIENKQIPVVKILGETMIPIHWIDSQFDGGNSPDGKTRLTYSLAEVATVLGVSRMTVHRGAHNGEIPTIKVMSKMVVPAEWLRRQLTNRD